MANGMSRCSQHFPHQCIRLLISIWREYNNQPIAAHCILFLLLLFYVLVLNLFFFIYIRLACTRMRQIQFGHIFFLFWYSENLDTIFGFFFIYFTKFFVIRIGVLTACSVRFSVLIFNSGCI